MPRKATATDTPTVQVDGKVLRPGQSYQGIEYRGKNKDGKDTWRILVYRGYRVVEDADGTRRRLNEYDKHTFTGTFREAKKFKAKLEAEREEGSYVAPARMTFGDFLTRWLASTQEQGV